MRRKQIYLDDASERALKRLAARTGRSAGRLEATELQAVDEALALVLDL